MSYDQETATSDEFVNVSSFILGDTDSTTGNGISATDAISIVGVSGTRTGNMARVTYSGLATQVALGSPFTLFDNSKTDPNAFDQPARFILDFSNFKAAENVNAVSFVIDESTNGLQEDLKLSDELLFTSVAAVHIRTFEASQDAIVAIDAAMQQIADSRAELVQFKTERCIQVITIPIFRFRFQKRIAGS